MRGRSATFQLRPPTTNRRLRVKRAQAGQRSLSLGRRLSKRACCARAPHRAGCGWSMPHEGHRTGERPLSFVARPEFDVSATAANTRPAAACQASADGPALAVSGGEARHTSLLRARAVLRLLKSGSCPMKGAPPARGSSLSVHGRGETCQLRPPTLDRQPRVRRAQARLR